MVDSLDGGSAHIKACTYTGKQKYMKIWDTYVNRSPSEVWKQESGVRAVEDSPRLPGVLFDPFPQSDFKSSVYLCSILFRDPASSFSFHLPPGSETNNACLRLRPFTSFHGLMFKDQGQFYPYHTVDTELEKSTLYSETLRVWRRRVQTSVGAWDYISIL